MPPSLLHLPNGQAIAVKPIFGGLRFEPQDLNIHSSPFPPGWIIILHTDDGSNLPDHEDHSGPSDTAVPARPVLPQKFRKPTINKDSMFISSISNPASNDFRPALSQSRQIAMMLWTTLYWYFHQEQPDPQSAASESATPKQGRPKAEWTIRIKRGGIFKGHYLLSKLERMGLAWSTDTSVGLDADGRIGDGFQELFVSQRSFWQIDARLFLFTLSPVASTPFLSSPHNSRPSSPSRLEYPREGGLVTTTIPLSPIAKAMEADQFNNNHGLWQKPPTPGPFASASNLPTYYPPPPCHFIISNGIRHPARPKPPRPGETFYTRYIPSKQQFLSFRTASSSDKPVAYRGPIGGGEENTSATADDIDDANPRINAFSHGPSTASSPTDVELLHRWMNDERVSRAWGEQGPREHQEKFLFNNLKSQHSFPMLGCWDGKPFCYCEIYWVKEDLLGKYVSNLGNFDRGVHLLVGENKFRGRDRFKIWMSAVVHWIWLSDPRTESIFLEPRVDNAKIIEYLQDVGFHKEREIALPHKQSALMRITRDAWEAPFI